MKRSVSLLVILAMIVTTFAGFATLATADQFLINFDTAFDIEAFRLLLRRRRKHFSIQKENRKLRADGSGVTSRREQRWSIR